MANFTTCKSKRKGVSDYLDRHGFVRALTMSPHRPTRRWCKTIRGKRHYFGPLDDWRATLDKWLDDVDTAAIGSTTFESYRRIAGYTLKVIGPDLDAAKLRPADFKRLMNRLRREYSPSQQAKYVTVVKMVFRCAFENELIDTPIWFGSTFKVASRAEKRRAVANRKLTYTADEVRRLLDAADVHLRAMILLGVVAGRDADRFGIGFYYMDISNDMRSLIGATPLGGRGVSAEKGVELFYNFQITPSMTLTPDIQFIMDPSLAKVAPTSADSDLAIVVGIRPQISF